MKKEICDDGAQMLAVGIVRQAVNDYCNCVEELVFYNAVEDARKQITVKYMKEGYDLTPEEADIFRQQEIKKIEAEMEGIEKFFKTDWYHELCIFDGAYMIKTTKEKSISNMVDSCIAKLNKIKKRNRFSKKSIKTLGEFQRLKLFLESDYLQRFTDKDCDYWLEQIRKQSKCIYCDLL